MSYDSSTWEKALLYISKLIFTMEANTSREQTATPGRPLAESA